MKSLLIVRSLPGFKFALLACLCSFGFTLDPLRSAVAQQTADILQETESGLEEAEREEKLLRTALDNNQGRVGLLTKARQILRSTLRLEKEIEAAEQTGDDATVESLSEEAAKAEAEFWEFVEVYKRLEGEREEIRFELAEFLDGGDTEQSDPEGFNDDAASHPPPMQINDADIAESKSYSFDADIVPLLKTACFDCHDAETASGDMNLQTLIATTPLVVNRDSWLNVIQQLKVGSMPPADADQPSEHDRRKITAWLTRAIEHFDYSTVSQPGYEPARRLTNDEYNHTIRDLVGIDLRPADKFPDDMTATSGFENSANSLFIQPITLERLVGAAELVATAALPDRPQSTAQQSARLRLLGDSGGRDSEHSVRGAITTFATRAYRRPVETEEIDALLKLYEQSIQDGAVPTTAMREVMQLVMVSPSFIIRTERNGAEAGVPFQITDWELASRLSYFLWASMPDDELFQLAAENRLHHADVLIEQVDRMLDDAKAETLGTIFAAQWLGFTHLPRIQPDQIDNPWANDSLLDAMQSESSLLFNSMIRENASVTRLIDADYTFLNEQLAGHYEIDGVSGTQMRRVSIAESPRRGVLGHGSIQAITAFPYRVSPVVRGNWILTDMLGTPPPPPPPNVSQFDEKVARAKMSPRKKLEMHRNNPNCYACHSQIDPLGFALSHFDWFGRYRPGKGTKGLSAEGKLPDGTTVHGLIELADALVESRLDDLTFQVTRKMLAYALGRQLEYYDEATVRDLVAQLQRNDRRMRVLVQGIVQSDTFQKKQVSVD